MQIWSNGIYEFDQINWFSENNTWRYWYKLNTVSLSNPSRFLSSMRLKFTFTFTFIMWETTNRPCFMNLSLILIHLIRWKLLSLLKKTRFGRNIPMETIEWSLYSCLQPNYESPRFISIKHVSKQQRDQINLIT